MTAKPTVEPRANVKIGQWRSLEPTILNGIRIDGFCRQNRTYRRTSYIRADRYTAIDERNSLADWLQNLHSVLPIDFLVYVSRQDSRFHILRRSDRILDGVPVVSRYR